MTDGFTGNAVLENNRRNSACDDGSSKEGIKGSKRFKETWSAFIEEYVLQLKNTLDYSQFGVRCSLVLKERS